MTELLPTKQQAQLPMSPIPPLLVTRTPQLYFNGFALYGGATDVTVVLQNGPHTVTTVQAGYSVLKELVTALAEIIETNETQLEVVYPKLGDILQKLKAEEGDGETT